MTGTLLRSTALTVLAIVLLAVTVLSGTGFSSAAYTSQTTNAASTASAAADWTPPTVSVIAPAAALKGAVSLSADAADAETGIRNVVLSVQAAGTGTWTALCTATAAPYRCSWDTTAVADGAYDVRAVATDNAGYATTSATVHVTVSNAFGITLSDPGEVVRGTVTLGATLQNAGVLLYTVRIEYAVAGSGNWRLLCGGLLSPHTCPWVTTAFPDGEYDLRAVGTYLASSATSAIITDVLVDNTSPTVTITNPGSPLSGTVSLSASAADAGSGVASVAIQYAPAGSSSWVTACTVADAPYTCRFNTMSLPRGAYSFRAIATDVAGNTAVSAAITNRQIDNTISSVSVEDPGAYLHGTTAVTANAASTAGVTSVSVQYAPTGTTGWTTVCVTFAPYTCQWDTTSVANGVYDLRAVLVDGNGKQTVSAVVAGRTVDNRPVRGLDVQAANGGGSAGRIDAGDALTLTYNKTMSLDSILAGWTGAPTAVSLRLRDGALIGAGSSGDTVDVLVGGGAANLGSVNLRGDFIKANKSATFAATMSAKTVDVGGTPVTVVTVTVGQLVNGGSGTLRAAGNAGTMIWTPSAAATDLAGAGSSNAPVSETGPADRDF